MMPGTICRMMENNVCEFHWIYVHYVETRESINGYAPVLLNIQVHMNNVYSYIISIEISQQLIHCILQRPVGMHQFRILIAGLVLPMWMCVCANDNNYLYKIISSIHALYGLRV